MLWSSVKKKGGALSSLRKFGRTIRKGRSTSENDAAAPAAEAARPKRAPLRDWQSDAQAESTSIFGAHMTWVSTAGMCFWFYLQHLKHSHPPDAQGVIPRGCWLRSSEARSIWKPRWRGKPQPTFRAMQIRASKHLVLLEFGVRTASARIPAVYCIYCVAMPKVLHCYADCRRRASPCCAAIWRRLRPSVGRSCGGLCTTTTSLSLRLRRCEKPRPLVKHHRWAYCSLMCPECMQNGCPCLARCNLHSCSVSRNTFAYLLHLCATPALLCGRA